MMWLFALMPMLYFVGIAGALYVAFRFVRAFEHRGVDRAELEALRSKVERLEDDAERVAADMRELEDGQRFTTRLLAERSSTSPTT